MHRFALLASVAALAASASAQFTMVIPAGMAAAEGSTSNAFPWGRGGTGLRLQCVYDSTNFTSQGVTYPVLISRLRWRPNTNVSSAASNYPTGATVQLSTCPLDQAAITTNMAGNQGADLTTCFTGPVSWPATTATPGPCPFLIDIPFTTNFLYDPNLGDLNIETDIPIQTFTGTGLQLDVHGTAPAASRAYLSTGYVNGGPNATATGVGLNHGVVVEVTYVPAAGLYAGFSATPTSGASPLLVQFTDRTYTSDPGGITSWAWDFDGDSVIDSTQQNPSWTYTNCGSYTVSLTVTDASHSPNTLTRTNFISTDVVVPSFTTSLIGTGLVQFTDTSTPTPTSWAWDFDGDNVIDSTAQNPVWFYPSACVAANVSLTVNRLCRGPYTVSRPVVASSGANSVLTGGNGTSSTTQVGNLFDISVLNPGGINICALAVTPYSFTGPFNASVYVTNDTYVGKDTNAAAWRLVGQGSGVTAAGTTSPPTPCNVALTTPFYLPAGNYGMAVYLQNPAGTVFIAYTNGPIGPFGNADISIVPSSATAPGIARTGLFGGSLLSPRVWNGTIYYSTPSTSGEAAYGFAGVGCAGTMPVSTQLPTSRPVLGQTVNVNLNNLPLSAAIMVMGLSRTNSPLGTLPLDLTVFGAPGCFARVSPDLTLFAFGAANAATWSLGIPNNAALIGLPLHTQAFVPDTINTLGGVMGDSAVMVLGN